MYVRFLFSSEKCGFPAGCNPLEACPGCIEEAVLLTAICMSLLLSCNLEWQVTLSLQTMGPLLTAFPLCDNARKTRLTVIQELQCKENEWGGEITSVCLFPDVERYRQ